MKHFFKGLAIGAALVAALAVVNPAEAVLYCQGQYASTWVVGNTGFTGLLGDGPYVCFADGAELKYIQRNFTGLRGRALPNLQGDREITWTGEDAQFIIDNL